MVPEQPRLRTVDDPADLPNAEDYGPPAPPNDGVTPPSRRGGSGRFLTDVLVDMGFVERERVDQAIATARTSSQTPERVLLDAGGLTQQQLSRAVAERYGLDHLDLAIFKVDMGAANLIGSSAAKRYEAVPVSFLDERTVLVAMADPSNVLAVDDIALMTGLDVKPAVAAREDVSALISRLNRLDDAVRAAVTAEEEETGREGEIVDLQESADDAPVVKLMNTIIAQAVDLGASDIHFEPHGRELRVRFRVDGVLAASATVPRRMVGGVVSRVKIMSELDISERRLPQDGRVGIVVDGRHVDIRVVTLPTVHGESVVMRILDKEGVVMNLDHLGMAPDDRERVENAIGRPYGAVLATGPTGSGKSTTLYAALTLLNTPEKNIITIEEPVEYQLEGITQIQVNNRAGLTFANGLRSMMRADPDIIMVGEIRDKQTAQIAVEAAITGHLVLSTLHTNDAPTALTRLTEMGVEPFLVASALDCVVAQRLARMLCASCKRRTLLSADVLRSNGYAASFDLEAYEPVGCSRCSNTGYKGRIGLYEVMMMTDDIRGPLLAQRPTSEIAAAAVANGMRRLRDDGFDKVRDGRTSITEIARVTNA
jgi:type IV pilus assembly protein PilB